MQEEELRASDGQEDRPAYVAYQGKVYDVSNSRLWRKGVHVRRHHAGQDLTSDFPAAPHDESIFQRVPMVAVLAADEDVEPEPTEGRLAALLDLYFGMHPHPVAVHFPVALGVVAAVFVILYMLTGNAGFEVASYYVLGAALVMTPMAMLTGAVSWWFNYGRTLDTRFSLKISLSLILLVVEAFAMALRAANPGSVVQRQPLGQTYALAAVVILLLVAMLGWIGARITFPPRRST